MSTSISTKRTSVAIDSTSGELNQATSPLKKHKAGDESPELVVPRTRRVLASLVTKPETETKLIVSAATSSPSKPTTAPKKDKSSTKKEKEEMDQKIAVLKPIEYLDRLESKFTLASWVKFVNTSSKLQRVRCSLSPMDVERALAVDGDKPLNCTSESSGWLLHTCYDGALALYDPNASMVRNMQVHGWSSDRINSYKKLCKEYASKTKDSEKKSVDELVKIAIHYLHPELWPQNKGKKSATSSSSSASEKGAATTERKSAIIIKAIARFDEKSKSQTLTAQDEQILEKYKAKLALVMMEEAEEDKKSAPLSSDNV